MIYNQFVCSGFVDFFIPSVEFEITFKSAVEVSLLVSLLWTIPANAKAFRIVCG